MRDRVPLCARALVYGSGFQAAEFISERVLRRLLGRAPWDYSNARWQLDGLTRFDYFPLWASAGLITERLHDIPTAQPRGQDATTGALSTTGGRQRKSS